MSGTDIWVDGTDEDFGAKGIPGESHLDVPSPVAASTITDLAWVDGVAVVAGLSNEEFTSRLRRVPYPFDGSARARRWRSTTSTTASTRQRRRSGR